ncbi:hypothetical protein [Nocardioides convexus]|nr:hypothetical protein [Nocardioides convexus]
MLGSSAFGGEGAATAATEVSTGSGAVGTARAPARAAAKASPKPG